ncbi:MAG: hypothetical protein DWQ07_15350 [Chloroflexi bacterium]|nr:MAG: hypothetical protein DWQ07_15350 [Chloroflexota bacterium]MBL1196404.1 hypothetical protein [Chloroflexota bacterium]
MRAAAYTRVSTDEQRENYSIPTQLEDIKAFADKHNWALVGDKYFSLETGKEVGKDSENAIPAFVDDHSSLEISRPDLDRAIQYLETTGFDILLVHALDRLARDPYIRETLEREIRSRGARVQFVLGNYEESPEGEVRKDLDATFAKWENLKRVERMNRGKRGKAQSGLFVQGRAPYAYRMNPLAFGGLEVIPEQADVVRRMFDWYTEEDLSIAGIVKRLEEQGIPSPLGKPRWGTSTVSRLLSNTAYIGRVYYNKSKSISKNERLPRPREEWIEIEITPLVSNPVFQKARLRLEQNKQRRRRQPRRFYMLSGLIVCDDCGKPFLAQTVPAGVNRQKVDAQHYRHRKSSGHCYNRMISARKLEPLVWATLVSWISDKDNIRHQLESRAEVAKELAEELDGKIEALQGRLARLEKKRDTLVDRYLDPDFPLSKEEFVSHKERLDGDILELVGQMEELDEQRQATYSPQDYAYIERLLSDLATVAEHPEEVSPQDRKEVLQILNAVVRVPREGEPFLHMAFYSNNGYLREAVGGIDFNFNDHTLKANDSTGMNNGKHQVFSYPNRITRYCNA